MSKMKWPKSFHPSVQVPELESLIFLYIFMYVCIMFANLALLNKTTYGYFGMTNFHSRNNFPERDPNFVYFNRS